MTIRRASLLAVLALAAGLGAGCVSASKYHSLESQKQDVEARHAALERDLAGLRQGTARTEAELTEQKAALEEDLAGLRRDRQRAETDLTALNERVADMERRTAEISAQKDEEIRRLRGTYDSLVEDLKGEIEKGEIKVTQIRDKLSVNLVEKVLFDSGHAEVKAQGEAVLKKVGAILGNVKGKEIRIEGYTDNVPIGENLRKRFASNWELSTQRATNVLRFLQDQAGVDGTRLSAVGYGPFRPIADNKTPEGRAENRRIEIVLVPQDVKEVLKELQ